MALIGNRSVLLKSPGRNLSGTVASIERSNFSTKGQLASRFQAMSGVLASIPSGHLAPSAWSMARTAGGLSSRNEATGAGSFAASGALGLNGEASLAGAGDIVAAFLQLVVSAVAVLTGGGGLTADIVGKLEAAADLAGSGGLSGAIGALADMVASLLGSGSVSGSPRAEGSMSANIRGYGEMTPEGIRDSVWNALAASLTTPGTAGAALLAAGSAGDPWGTPLPGAYAPGSAGAILGEMLQSIGARLVENGLSQDEVTRIMLAALAGKRQGLGTATEQYLSQDNSKARITLVPDVDGNGDPTVDGS